MVKNIQCSHSIWKKINLEDNKILYQNKIFIENSAWNGMCSTQTKYGENNLVSCGWNYHGPRNLADSSTPWFHTTYKNQSEKMGHNKRTHHSDRKVR